MSSAICSAGRSASIGRSRTSGRGRAAAGRATTPRRRPRRRPGAPRPARSGCAAGAVSQTAVEGAARLARKRRDGGAFGRVEEGRVENDRLAGGETGAGVGEDARVDHSRFVRRRPPGSATSGSTPGAPCARVVAAQVHGARNRGKGTGRAGARQSSCPSPKARPRRRGGGGAARGRPPRRRGRPAPPAGPAGRGARGLHRDHRPDRRPDGEKERQRRQRPEVAGPGEPGVEADVCLPRQSPLIEVHEQEGEVVARVAGAEPFVELERVEGDRAAVEQDEVGEVQVRVAAADMALGGAAGEERGKPGVERAAASEKSDIARTPSASSSREDAGEFGEDLADERAAVLGPDLRPRRGTAPPRRRGRGRGPRRDGRPRPRGRAAPRPGSGASRARIRRARPLRRGPARRPDRASPRPPGDRATGAAGAFSASSRSRIALRFARVEKSR
jgi:hypothetical protein